LKTLVSDDRRKQAEASLAEIADRARSNFEEKGLNTLFLALGLASWTAADGGRDAASPVLLVPLEASQDGRGGQWRLKRSGEVKVNDVLMHALREEHGVRLDATVLSGEILGDDEGEVFDLAPVFQRLQSASANAPGFAIASKWLIGNFSFQKMAIVNDLQQLRDALARHDIVAGISGDVIARGSACGDRTLSDATTFDQQPPDQEFLILDADSSQQQAIAATLSSRNGVISGPPGTGKSQTIANL